MYWKTQYQLAISSLTGGTTKPAPGSYWYDQGVAVQVSATPSSGYTFVNWELDARGLDNNITTQFATQVAERAILGSDYARAEYDGEPGY